MKERTLKTNNRIKNLPDSSKIHTKEGLIEIIDALPLAIAVINRNRNVILANRKTYQFVNKNETELIGRVGGEALGCIHHNDVPEGCGFGEACLKCKLRETVLATMHRKKAHHMVESTMVFNQHGEMHIRISTQPLNLDREEVVLLAIEDITEVKKHEQFMLEKEKLSAVLQTAGAVSHEMNQPLMIITGLVDLMLSDIKDGNIDEKHLAKLKVQTKRLGEITKKMTEITRYETKPYLNGEIIDIDASSKGTPVS